MEFLSKFAHTHCPVRANEFWGYPRPQAATLQQCALGARVADDIRKRLTRSVEKTNNKQMVVALSDLIIGGGRVVI